MVKPFARQARHYYSLVNTFEKQSKSPCLGLSRFHFLFVLITITVSTACFFAGRYSKDVELGDFIHLNVKPEVFIYNRTFGARPSNETDAAWESLFPSQGGFFSHPDLAPQRSALSVFHQLHCLNGIRNSYWLLFAAATSGKLVLEEELPMMASPPHIRHCIDLIRQTLMCQPDIAIEEKNLELGGVSGFGVEHKCKDWEQVMGWVEKWQDYGRDEERERVKSHGGTEDHKHHHHDEHE